MAKKSQIQKSKRKVKFSTREKKRCFKCGRPHGYLDGLDCADSVSGKWLSKVKSLV